MRSASSARKRTPSGFQRLGVHHREQQVLVAAEGGYEALVGGDLLALAAVERRVARLDAHLRRVPREPRRRERHRDHERHAAARKKPLHRRMMTHRRASASATPSRAATAQRLPGEVSPGTGVSRPSRPPPRRPHSAWRGAGRPRYWPSGSQVRAAVEGSPWPGGRIAILRTTRRKRDGGRPRRTELEDGDERSARRRARDRDRALRGRTRGGFPARRSRCRRDQGRAAAERRDLPAFAPGLLGLPERLSGRPRLPSRQPRQALADAGPHQPRGTQRAAARRSTRRTSSPRICCPRAA